VIEDLMEKIRRDPRVKVCKEFRKDVQVKNTGWDMSMCYWFDVPALLPEFQKYPDRTIQDLFDSIGDTFEVKRDVWGLAKFYENCVDRILVKWVAQDQESNRVYTSRSTTCNNACIVQ